MKTKTYAIKPSIRSGYSLQELKDMLEVARNPRLCYLFTFEEIRSEIARREALKYHMLYG
ncbi:MAG: hypothetical protein M0R32_02670 [Candidatus Cloacimonetes bacterium]|jgi:hypothetical protein|nr:hypothetical protein [Candidatus Cloacimonadota bacterium]